MRKFLGSTLIIVMWFGVFLLVRYSFGFEIAIGASISCLASLVVLSKESK